MSHSALYEETLPAVFTTANASTYKCTTHSESQLNSKCIAKLFSELRRHK